MSMARVGLLTLLAGGTALASAEKLSPALAPIVEAERAFARRCGEVGIRQSFLEFFAPESVSFAPDPGAARARLEARPAPREPPPVLLEWGPEMAEVDAAGAMGWTTGPSRFTDKSGKRPPHHGYYFSVWKKQPDGSFKVVIDVGTDAPRETPIPTVAQAVGPTTAKAGVGPVATFADLQRRDEAFCAAAETGAAKAYAGALAANARMHLDTTMPVVGEKAWRPWVKRMAGVMSCKPLGGDVGAGLAYTYGSWERRAAAGGDVIGKGFYARVWRKGREWQIAADVRTLAE